MPGSFLRFNCLGIPVVQRQANDENASFVDLTFYRDVSAHQVDKCPADCQSQARAGPGLSPGLGLLELLEQFVLLFERNPRSRILDFDPEIWSRHSLAFGDRTEFLGRNGSPASPAAMRRTRLSNRTGAGLDPCTAIQTQLMLDDRQERVIVFTLGAAGSEHDARHLVQRFRGAGNAMQALEGVWHYWSETLGAVYVETPDLAVNFMANGWMIYQTLSCRMWARTGFYQSGGAFGFRDQLQDAMALIHAKPDVLRQHLLRAAAQQFREGDVQHWWHPPVGRDVPC